MCDLRLGVGMCDPRLRLGGSSPYHSLKVGQVSSCPRVTQQQAMSIPPF